MISLLDIWWKMIMTGSESQNVDSTERVFATVSDIQETVFVFMLLVDRSHCSTVTKKKKITNNILLSIIILFLSFDNVNS